MLFDPIPPDRLLQSPPDPRLQPAPEYREMAEAVLRATPALHDFLSRCAACGLPVDDRLEAIVAQHEFCENFCKYHFPTP